MNHYAEGYEVPPCSIIDLRRLSALIRQMFGLDPNKAFPIAHFMEYALDSLYDDFRLEICTHAELREKHGETFPGRHLIRLREDVYEGMYNGNGQDIFTAAHECSHLIKHEKVPVSMARRRAENLPIYRNSEWQADTLAAELLMPYEVAKDLQPYEIKKRYLVSSSAAQTRYDKLRKEAMRMSAYKKRSA